MILWYLYGIIVATILNIILTILVWYHGEDIYLKNIIVLLYFSLLSWITVLIFTIFIVTIIFNYIYDIVDKEETKPFIKNRKSKQVL